MKLLGARVLLVEDDSGPRRLFRTVLGRAGAVVEEVGSAEQALAVLARHQHDLVVLDLGLPGMSGLELLEVAPRSEATRYVVVTGSDSVQDAVRAVRAGAYQYLTKPVDVQAFQVTLERAWEELQLASEVAALRAMVAGHTNPLVGRSPALEALQRTIARVAPSRATVLITGETGTGKELVARRLHELSERSAGPFVPVNLAALPDTLLESTLFGHEQGSFTGATSSLAGLIELANGGTLFLDEASCIPPAVQVKLLRVLQDRTVTRIGSHFARESDFRLLAASNVSLAREVAEGRFREDLYYRLAVIEIQVPPLRERAEDIPLLAAFFAERMVRENGGAPLQFCARTLERFGAYDWPGNVRELQNVVERAVVLHEGDGPLSIDPLRRGEPSAAFGVLDQGSAGNWTLAELERAYILRVLERNQGHRTRTAEQLGIDRRTLYLKLRGYQRASPSQPAGAPSSPAA